MKYTNEIDTKLIREVLSEEEYNNAKDIAKQLYYLNEERRLIEQNLLTRLDGRVIGKLAGIKLNYLAWGNTFYVSYTDNNKPNNLINRLLGWLL